MNSKNLKKKIFPPKLMEFCILLISGHYNKPPLIVGEIHTNIRSRAVLIFCDPLRYTVFAFNLQPASTGRYTVFALICNPSQQVTILT